jgi:hypothetical protein
MTVVKKVGFLELQIFRVMGVKEGLRQMVFDWGWRPSFG